MREGSWLKQVLRNLAGALLQAARWRAWEEAGNTPGPEDLTSSWPRLPDTPGERVALGLTRLDLSTAEGWATAQELLQSQDWKANGWLDTVEDLTGTLADTLEHSPLLSSSFYSRHSKRAGTLLTTEQRPVTVLGGGVQSLWKTPEHPLGVPPEGSAWRAVNESLGLNPETVALDQVAWEAARELYRSLGNGEPDEHGRRGLERPEVLRLWGERLGLLEPDGSLAVGPLGDEETQRAATGLPWSKAQATLLSPRIREHDGDLPAGQLHRSRQALDPSRNTYEALVGLADHSSAIRSEPMAWAHVQRAQQLLETHGPEMARLSLYLSMHVCGRPNPLEPFVVTGEALLRDFDMESTSGGRGREAIQERSNRLKHQAEMAKALDLVAVQCKDYLGPPDKNGNRPFRRYTGRLWNVESLELGTETQLTLDGQVSVPKGEIVTSLRLLVRPGSWVLQYPTQASGTGEQLWYGHVATAVLRLSHQKNQLAACLGLFLSTALREWRAQRTGTAEFTVGQLLERVLPEKELDKAKATRQTSERLRNKWVAALELLHHLVGFRFTFCPDTYPTWAIPEVLLGDREPWLKPADRGALEKLLKGRLTVQWPTPVIEAARESKASAESKALVAEIKTPRIKATTSSRTPKEAPRGTPPGVLLRQAREAAQLNQRAAAKVLGISQSELSKLECGSRTLRRNVLDRYLEQLKTVSQADRFHRATGRAS
jgi:DNA-binding XRE family transcriptional regulator